MFENYASRFMKRLFTITTGVLGTSMQLWMKRFIFGKRYEIYNVVWGIGTLNRGECLADAPYLVTYVGSIYNVVWGIGTLNSGECLADAPYLVRYVGSIYNVVWGIGTLNRGECLADAPYLVRYVGQHL